METTLYVMTRESGNRVPKDFERTVLRLLSESPNLRLTFGNLREEMSKTDLPGHYTISLVIEWLQEMKKLKEISLYIAEKGMIPQYITLTQAGSLRLENLQKIETNTRTTVETPPPYMIPPSSKVLSLDRRLALNGLAKFLSNYDFIQYDDFIHAAIVTRIPRASRERLGETLKGLDPKSFYDRVTWNASKYTVTELFECLSVFAERGEEFFLTLVKILLEKIVDKSTESLSVNQSIDRRISELEKTFNFILSPFGLFTKISFNSTPYRSCSVRTIKLGGEEIEKYFPNMLDILDSKYPEVHRALTSAYEIYSTDTPPSGNAAMDFCRNSIQSLVKLLTHGDWGKESIKKVTDSKSGSDLVYEVFSFLSGKGSTHYSKNARPGEVDLGIRMTENCIAYLMICSGDLNP